MRERELKFSHSENTPLESDLAKSASGLKRKSTRIMPNESGVLLLEGNEPLEKDPFTDKVIIKCEKVKRQELTYD